MTSIRLDPEAVAVLAAASREVQEDVTTVRGYALACCDDAARKRDEASGEIDKLLLSRDAADLSLERCRSACELAERMSVFAARAMAGDVEPDTLRKAAAAIRELTREVGQSSGEIREGGVQ